MSDVLVVGAGSIGARHARNLVALGAKVTVVDTDERRASAVADELAIRSESFDPEQFGSHDGVVIASPTIFHADHMRAALAGGARVLVEKPLAFHSSEVSDVTGELERVMVGYNLRLHRPVQELMALLAAGDLGRILSARLWFGSWLPDWRPNVDYRETYSARAELGGGILLDAIHELDLLLWMAHDNDAFDVIGAVVERLGPLDIDVEDTAHALLRHADGWVAEIAVDYLSRQYRRGVEIVGTEGTGRVDWARKVVEREANGHVDVRSADVPVDRSYEIEAARFLAFLDDGEVPPVDGIVGLRSLELSERIRQGAR